MALFEPFPNYIWNLSVAIAMESGAQLGEIIDMCQPIKDAAASGADAGTPQFMAAWAAMGDKLVTLASEDEARGRAFSASNKLERASLYLITAERMQGHGAPGRKETYARARDAFDRSTALGRLNRERVEIPLEKGMMPALYTRAPGEGRHPVVVFCNGLDSCKELLYWTRLPEELARRGISTLCVDQPGSGEVLVDGVSARFRSPREAMSRRIAYSSENRRTEGVIGDLSVLDNISLALQAQRGVLRRMSTARRRELATSWVEALHIRPADIDRPVSTLSGGNQQKVLLARLLALSPRVIVLDEPTRGIDVGAKAEIQRLVGELSDNGLSIIYISAELDEVLRVAHLVAVMRDGVLAQIVPAVDLTPDALLALVAGHESPGEAVHG